MDVSVVVPTHNGADRLPRTLAGIAAQTPPAGLEWEVILVDNASTDDTAAKALAAWPADAPVPLRVVHEENLGLGNAHLRGFAEASGHLVTWVEDDNWIAPDWLEVVSAVMADHPEVGACGGFNEPACEIDPPPWFERFQSAYAVGAQGEPGDVTESRGYLWGAGLTVRYSAWEHLAEKGFEALLPDRQGAANFNSGGDSELCFALRLSGWRLRFEPRLRLQHFLLAHRLDWTYLRRLFRGVGASTVGFDPYLQALAGANGRRCGWRREAARVLTRLPLKVGTARRSRLGSAEGELGVLELESDLGRLSELRRLRGAYDESFRAVAEAPWRRSHPG